MRIFQKGFNYSQDGPGNRLVYHLMGCNLSCKWCSNPEGMDIDGKCTELTTKEIAEEILSCKAMFFSGGGVTFSGGEPTLQFTELSELLRLLKQKGINTAIETNGTHKELVSLFPFIDHLMMDFKHYDSETHRKWTGAGNETVQANFKSIAASGKRALIRIPVINGFNNSPDGFVSFFREFNVENIRFEILPYHEYGRVKWDKPYEVTNGFITKDDVEKFEKIFNENGLKTVRM